MNELRTKLNDCGSPIKDDRLIYLIQNKLSLDYSTFVSSFNTTKATLGASYKKITFDDYAQLLEDEQAKLITMGILKSSKSKAFVANNESSKNLIGESSNKGKGKKKKWKDK